jgi:hypothetical protein
MKRIFKKSAKFSLKGIDLTQYILTSAFCEEESHPNTSCAKDKDETLHFVQGDEEGKGDGEETSSG